MLDLSPLGELATPIVATINQEALNKENKKMKTEQYILKDVKLNTFTMKRK